jgi:hypothetical protein
MLNSRPAVSCRPGSALAAELPARLTPGGIRTRDLSFFRRSNSDLHHGPCRHSADAYASAVERHAGERAISVSVTPTQVLAQGKNRSPRRNGRARPLPRYVTPKAGIEPALSRVRSIRNLHHQRSVEPPVAANRTEKKFTRGALNGAPQGANPNEVRSAIGIRLPPRSLRQAPRAWATRHQARAPGSGSPVPAFAGKSLRRAALRTTKNPPERLAREGPCKTDYRFRLREIAPMSRA